MTLYGGGCGTFRKWRLMGESPQLKADLPFYNAALASYHISVS